MAEAAVRFVAFMCGHPPCALGIRVHPVMVPAGLLACGSLWCPAFPARASGIVGRHSPLTVAGAATGLVPDGYAAPCSLLIPLPWPGWEPAPHRRDTGGREREGARLESSGGRSS